MTRGLLAGWAATGFQAYALSRLEPGGRGALRSFSALILALPVYMLSAWFQAGNPDLATHLGALVIDALFYAFGWVVFAGMMVYLTRFLDLGENLPRLISAYNWSRVMVLLMLVPLSIIAGLSLTSANIENLIFLMSWGYAFSYKTFVVRHALGASWVQAVLIVLLELIALRMVQQISLVF